MKSLFFSIALFLLTPGTEDIDNHLALQEVLDIEEFKQYIKSPRFVSSQDHQILLLSHEMINKEAKFAINQIPIKIVDSTTAINNEKLFYIQLKEFKIDQKNAQISLNYQNARLLFEENKKINLEANLKKSGNEWKIVNYKVNEVSTSY